MEASKKQHAGHLLIVDDESSVRSALRRLLRKEKYRMTCVESAADALVALRDDPPDVIISDHLMPDMTGLELMKRVRLTAPLVARIVLTGQAEMETVIAAINDGAVFRFLRKPWDDDEVKLTVHLAVAHAKEQRELAERARATTESENEDNGLRQLEAAYPGIAAIERDAEGAILIDDDDLSAI